MAIAPYESLYQPDNASLVVTTAAGQVYYLCTVYLDNVTNTVRASIVIRQENGRTVALFKNRVVATATLPEIVDTPRVLASGSTFVIHWLQGQGEVSAEIRRSTLDMATYGTTSTWTYQGAIPTNEQAYLYDAFPVVGHAPGDFVVTHIAVATGRVLVNRYDAQSGYTWLDTDWTTTTGVIPAHRVLGGYGSTLDGDVVVGYQSATSPNTIAALRVNASDGLGFASLNIFTQLPLPVEATQLSMTRFGPVDIAVVAEVQEVEVPPRQFPAPLLIGRRIRSSDLVGIGNEHGAYHLRMLSRPFAYAGARTDGAQPNIYVAVGYKHLDDDDDWGQAIGFIVNFDAQRWLDDTLTVRPRPVVNINNQLIDARVSGAVVAGSAVLNTATGRRANHLSSVALANPTGPGQKTRTVAILSYAKLLKVSSNILTSPLIPTAGTVSSYQVVLEDAWVRNRDIADPVFPPTENFYEAYRQTQYQHAEVAGQLVVSGGTPQVYDRTALFELGTPWWPEIMAADRLAGGSFDPGTRSYVVVYEHRDAAGRLTRSRPSTPVSVGIALNERVRLRISTLTISLRDSSTYYIDTPPYVMTVYRTVAGGTIYYRLFGEGSGGTNYRPQDAPDNDATTWEVQVTDDGTVDDTILQTHDVLDFQFVNAQWTPLPPQAPPACGPITTWVNRVWLAPTTERTIWYSNEILPEPGGAIPTPPEFNPQLVFRVDHLDEVTGLSSMDDLLVIFTRTQIYGLSGLPADATGQNSTLRLTTISDVVGCIEPRSVERTIEGVFFQSANGFTLLTRTLEVSYVAAGWAVEATIRQGGNIRGVHNLPDRHELRIVTNGAVQGEPIVLAYNYLLKRWSTMPLPNGDADAWLSATAGGAAWRGALGRSLHVCLQQGALLVEKRPGTTNEYADEGVAGEVAVPIRIETGWVSVGGIQAWRRNREVQVQTYQYEDSEITVDVYNDVNGNHDDTLVTSKLFVSPSPPLLRKQLRYQKFPIRIAVRESGNVPLTRNLSVVGFSLVVGKLTKHRRRRY